jgi:hypothetical protein
MRPHPSHRPSGTKSFASNGREACMSASPRMIPKDHAPRTREAERQEARPTIGRACETRQRLQREPLASRRSTAALASANERLSSAPAALRGQPCACGTNAPASEGLGVIGCHPHLRLSQSSELLAGRSITAGRAVSGAAWERDYEPRPQAPHPLRQSAVTG